MAQSSLRIALPKKPSGSAGRFWPNHRIHVLKAKALLFSSDYGRGFGSVFHHQTSFKRLQRLAKNPAGLGSAGFFVGTPSTPITELAPAAMLDEAACTPSYS
jgi:hypothetical protein